MVYSNKERSVGTQVVYWDGYTGALNTLSNKAIWRNINYEQIVQLKT